MYQLIIVFHDRCRHPVSLSILLIPGLGFSPRHPNGEGLPQRGKRCTIRLICLPAQNTKADSIAIPRGESWAALQEAKLLGIVSIKSTWSAQDFSREITNLFGPSCGVFQEELIQ